jgi:hypothetical protein
MSAKTLEERLQHVEDVRAIKNLVSSYTYYYAAGDFDQLENLFVRHNPEACITMSDWGAWKGQNGVHRFYGFMKNRAGNRVGLMSQHCFTVPVIEVAGDGMTATCLWVLLGVVAASKEGNTPDAVWNWAKVGMVLEKEDNQWRFLRFHLYELLQFPFEGGMEEIKAPSKPDIPEEFKPDTTDVKDYQYTVNSGPVYIPVPPAPYEHYCKDETY